MLQLMGKQMFTFYAEKFCLSKPMHVSEDKLKT